MIVSVSVCEVRPQSVRFTVEELAGRDRMFRMGIEINGVEVAHLFDVPRRALEGLEFSIRAALIDSEEVCLGDGVQPAQSV